VVVRVHILRLLIEGFEVDGIKLSVLLAFLFIVTELPALGDFASLVRHLLLLTTVDLRDIVATGIGRKCAVNWSILVQNA